MAKKCTKKRDARANLLFCSIELLLCSRSCCRRVVVPKTPYYVRLGLPSSTTTCNGKMPRELLRPRFETKVGNFIYRRNKRTKKRQEITLQQLYSGYVKFSWGIYRKGPWKRKSRKCVFKRTGSRKDTRENLRKMMNLLQSKDS